VLVSTCTVSFKSLQILQLKSRNLLKATLAIDVYTFTTVADKYINDYVEKQTGSITVGFATLILERMDGWMVRV